MPDNDDGGDYRLKVYRDTFTVYRDAPGAWFFRLLIFLLPVALAVAIIWVISSAAITPPPAPIPTTTVTQRAGEIVTTTTYLTQTYGLGAFDPALGSFRPLSVSILLLVVGTGVEIMLIAWYASLYLGNPRREKWPLSLPLGSVRVLIIMLLVITLLTFALLPGIWGENKAVTAIFSLLATVVGFYFGSSTVRETIEPANRPGGQGQPFSVTSLSPNSGAPGATLDVRILGTGFQAGSTANFGDQITVNSTSYVSPTELVAKITIQTGAPTGTRDVTVTLPNNQSRTLHHTFTVS